MSGKDETFSYKFDEIEKLVLNNNPSSLAMQVLELQYRIKQLEADIVKLQAKQFKDLAEIALKWEQKNQRLTEAIEFEINQPMQIARQQERLQKALKEGSK